MTEWEDDDHKLWEIWRWLVHEEGCYDWAAADILCTLLSRVADGERALRGETNEPARKLPEHADRIRERVQDMDLPDREMLLLMLDDEDGKQLRFWLDAMHKSLARCDEQDWFLDERPSFVMILVDCVRRYRARHQDDDGWWND
jgi:hypothetical protein